MLCPSCGSDSRVIDSRGNDDGTALRRRRLCTACGLRWTTWERDETYPDFEQLVQLSKSLRTVKVLVEDALSKLNAVIAGKDS